LPFSNRKGLRINEDPNQKKFKRESLFFKLHQKINDKSLGNFYFDLEADLTELFHWNNKQLFIYLMAEYKTETNDINQVIVWDKIIKRGEKSKLNLKRKPLKYRFFDDGQGGLVDNDNVTLSLWYNTVPNAGILPLVKAIGGQTIGFAGKRLIDFVI
jgi:hypothetical protein